MASVFESLTDDVNQAVDIAVELEQMLAIPVIWTPNITQDDLQLQLYQSTRSHLAAKELLCGNINWDDYLTYVEELKIDSASLVDLWDKERYLF